MNEYSGGYVGRYRDYMPHRYMVEDKEATKEAAYRELEEMVTEALKFMDANDITIFELEINSPQRKKSWMIKAEERTLEVRPGWMNNWEAATEETK